ncbi:MAG: FAD:protein FMN transferase [Amnibacterium sp.]
MTLRSVHVEHVMGTVVSIDLRGIGDHASAIADAVAWFHEVDRRFSPYREDSEVSRISRGEIAEADRSADLVEVLAACARVRDLSHGHFDAWRNGVLDPSAFVKGWSVDRAAALLGLHGCQDWMINAGGDVLTRGAPEPGMPWRVGVQHPFQRDAVAVVVAGQDLAVATSGTYERGAHIVDAVSGRAPAGVASVTVLGPELGWADAMSTAAFAMGEDGPAWLAGIDGFESYTVLEDGRVLATAGFPTTVHGVTVSTTTAGDPLRP